jgi:hypothetical protein
MNAKVRHPYPVIGRKKYRAWQISAAGQIQG